MRIEKTLREEIQNELEELGKIEAGTETYRTTVDGVTKLMDRAIEIEKLNIDHEQKEKDREDENKLKLAQMEEERKDRKIRNGLTAASIIIPAGLTIWGTIKSIEFEKEGTITTLIGRGFINKLLPKK